MKKVDRPHLPLICPACVAAKLKALKEETLLQQALASRAKEALSAEILRHDRQRQRCRKQDLHLRIEQLRDSCHATRDQMFEGRIDAADLRYSTIEKEQKIKEAWGHLKHKERDLVTMVLEPLRCCLQEELQLGVEELAELRRSKVLQAMEFFKVGMSGGGGGEIQGMPLPRYIHSFNRGGSIAECMAITQLGRLTDIIARYLNIPLPFAIDYRPSQCIIRGGGREGTLELALSPPLHTVSGAPSFSSAPPNTHNTPSDEHWMRQYRRALHLLALNVRHLLWTQVEEGTEEEEAYLKMCATNDISPVVTLHTLCALCSQHRLGRGEARSCEYAYAQEKLFAVAGRQGEITVRQAGGERGERERERA
eukprot:CAMPEP_0181325082 /NCGR_PEP_ID=MMETSP1101-20121128/20721_1 /TAXON_ID=46948 /ORGANISM="Rhodomonas abbreviata, Strain Caron Lab Isolate" /LENGTH=365 /DNA_ID=CAMNT_0023433337 /DNA_START=15 /DNA_END=1109 /DNA_ORIENTATION=+